MESFSNDAAKMIGECAAMSAKLNAWDTASMALMKPWEDQLNDMKQKLYDGTECMTSILQGRPDPQGEKTTAKTLQDATTLYELILPVHNSVMAATSALKK